MASYDEVMTALRNAHEAGDTEAATRLAAMAKGLQGQDESSALKAGAKSAIESTIPAMGGLAGAGAAITYGAPLIAASGPFAPATAIGLGLAGGFGGSYLAGQAQDVATSQIPESVKQATGFDAETRQAEQEQHPYASFAGSLAPNLAAFRPGSLAPIVTQAGKVISPLTQRLGMAGLGAGIEAGQEAYQGQPIEPWKVAAAGAFQGVAATPTRLGKKFFPEHGAAAIEAPTASDALQRARELEAQQKGIPVSTSEEATPDMFGQEPGGAGLSKYNAHGTYDYVDENGMPVKQALSEEIAQQPQQGDLFGAPANPLHPQEVAEAQRQIDIDRQQVEDAKATAKTEEDQQRVAAAEKAIQDRQTALEESVQRALGIHPDQQPTELELQRRQAANLTNRPVAAESIAAREAENQARSDETLGAQEAAATAAAKEGQGKTTLAETPIYELGPDGRLRVKQPTVEITTLPVPTSLESAAAKVGEGRRFALSAEERVAWEKTKIAIDSADTGMTKLTDKEVWNRMQDRQWVQDAIDRIKQRRDMWADIAERSADRKEVQDAIRRREVLDEHLENLQETLKARPDNSTKIQGTKTRTANRMSFNKQSGKISADFLGVGKAADWIKSGIKMVSDAYHAVNEALSTLSTGIDDSLRMGKNLFFKADAFATNYFNKLIPEAKTGAALATPDTPTELASKILAPGVTDTPSIWNKIQSGMGLAATKFNNHPLLLGAQRYLNHGLAQGEFMVRKMVQPLEKFIGTMTSKEQLDLHEIMKDEMFSERKFSDSTLNQVLTPKQKQAYDMMRKAFDTTYEAQNTERVRMGKSEITRGEAYMASNWHGDYHIPILDKSGKLAWYIRTTTRGEANRAIAYLRDKMGDTLNLPKDLKPEFRGDGRNPMAPPDIAGTYHDMMGFFKDNPIVSEQIKAALKDYLQEKGYTTAGQNKHFLEKSNVRGFEGDRPWLSPQENAVAGLKSQMDYLKGAAKWTHMQKAIADLREVLANPDVVTKNPNAVEYAKTVVAGQLGLDDNWFKAVEQNIAKYTGYSKGSISSGTNTLKTFTYLQVLGLSPGFMLATPLQAVTSTAAWHRVLSTEGYKHNIAATSLKAMGDTMAGLATHSAHELGITDKQAPMTEIGARFLAYAEDSGLISKNLFDENVGLGSGAIGQGAKSALGWTIGFPEKVARLGSAMSLMHHLNASGKYTGRELEMFRHAEELTDNAVTSFKPHDKPQIVNNLGTIGQMSYMYKSFIFNEYNQLSAFFRMAREGTPSPLMTHLGMLGLMGGALSLPLVDEMDGIWNAVKDGIATFAPSYYDKVKGVGLKGNIISMMDRTSGVRDLFPYGAVSVGSGAQMQSRFGVGTVDTEKLLKGDIGGGLGGIAPVAQEIKEQAGLAKAGIYGNKDALFSGIYNNVPPLMQGNMETRLGNAKGPMQPSGQIYYKPQTLENPEPQAHLRTPTDVGYRQLGLQSLAESRDKQSQAIVNAENHRVDTAKEELVKRVLSGIKRGDKEDIQQFASHLVQLAPDEKLLDSAINNAAVKLGMTPMQQSAVRMRTLQELQRYQDYQRLSK